MYRQDKELAELVLRGYQMGKDHARSGGSARVALERGTDAYKQGFAEEVYAQMRTSAMWSKATKDAVRVCLEDGTPTNIRAGLEIIGNANGEEAE